MINLITTILILITSILSFFGGYYCYPIINPNKDNTKDNTTNNLPNKPIITETTTTILKKKDTPEEPDVSIKNNYTVEIDGDKIEIPKNHTGQMSHDVDLTPVIKQLADAEYKKNWEVGTGLGRSHDGDFYVPFSLQRNYNYDKALEVQIGLTKDHIENIQVTHKWKF